MNQQTLRFRVGVFVLGMLLLLAVLVTLFGTLPSLFKHQNEYTVLFTDAAGVDAGTPVRRSGVRIGEVRKVVLDDATGRVRVTIMVNTHYTIRHNEQAMVVRGLLGGDTNIDFVPMRGDIAAHDRSAVAPGEELEGMEATNVTMLLNQAAEVVPTTQDTLNEMRKSLKRLESMSPLAESTMKEYQELARATREMVPELRETNKTIQGLAKDIQQFVPELRRTNTQVQELVKATSDTVPALRQTNDEIRLAAISWNRLGERVNVLLQHNEDKLVKVVDNLNESLQRISSVFNDENRQNLTTVLRNVKAGSDNLESISKGTDELLKESRTAIKRINDSVAKSDEVINNLQQATKPMAERSASIVRNLDESTEKLNRMLTDVRELTRAFNQADGTLAKLLNDPKLYNHLDEVVCGFMRILPRVDRAMKDIEVFTDKLARHPELIGVGGAIHGSNGVKEASH